MLFLLSFFSEKQTFAQTKDQIVNLIWQGLGGKQGWNEARYFMFSCKSNLNKTLSREHAYIWDRNTGNCRFEGTNEQEQKIIALFNTENNKGRAFVDNKTINNSDSAALLISSIINAFNTETFWLFPPRNLTESSLLTVKEAELIGSVRYNVIEIRQSPTDSAEFRTKIYVDANTGRIFQWQTLDEGDNIKYNFVTSDFKDVGGGLTLATTFTDTKDGFFIKFPIVSALINVESDKFSKP